MICSANYKSLKRSKNIINYDFLFGDIQKQARYKSDSSKKERTKLTLAKFNSNLEQNDYSNSSVNTNISIMKVPKVECLSNKYNVKPMEKEKFENRFIQKKKIVYHTPAIFNNKEISFQKQTNKQIMEFTLFDEDLIFKDINPSYLQDEFSDDGSESSDEKICKGSIFFSQELEDSAKVLSANLQKKQINKLLSRKMRFKKENQ